LSYAPLFWVEFGSGNVGVSQINKVTLRGGARITEYLPEQISIAWTDDCSVERVSNLGHSRGDLEEEMSIDGGAGEVIEKLEITNIPLAKQLGTNDFSHSSRLCGIGQVKFIRVSRTYQHERPTVLTDSQITTSFGKSICVGEESSDKADRRCLKAAAGEVITGFYACRVSTKG
jgi:hypothetical protein